MVVTDDHRSVTITIYAKAIFQLKTKGIEQLQFFYYHHLHITGQILRKHLINHTTVDWQILNTFITANVIFDHNKLIKAKCEEKIFFWTKLYPPKVLLVFTTMNSNLLQCHCVTFLGSKC